MIKVGVIGTGFIATQKHLPAWQKLASAAKITALCDVNLERGQEIARRFDVPRVYPDLQSMLLSERLDVVDICTPPKTHSLLAVEALQSGAHVLIEKPMAVTVEECDTI